MTAVTDNTIRARPCPECHVCGSAGQPLYQGLRDRLFGAPGKWNLKRCPTLDCGLVWLDPMPVEEDIGKAYETYPTHDDVREPPNTLLRRAYRHVKNGYLANKYGYNDANVTSFDRLLAGLIYIHPGRRSELDFSVFYLNAWPNRYLLDVGCGSGAMLASMQERGWRVEGVDIDPKAVQNARAKGLKVHLGSLAEQKFPTNIFDTITMSHVIEHVLDPLALLRECRRVLKPGGCLVVMTPNVASWGHRLYRAEWLGLDPPRHLHVFTCSSLAYLVRQASLQASAVSTTIRDAHRVFLASRSIRRTGGYDMGSLQPRAAWAWARAMQMVEWATLKLKPDIGEELLLIGKKP